MKRGLALAAVVLLTVLSGCGRNNSASSGSGDSAAASGPIDSSKCPAAASAKITGDTITLGMTLAQSGPVAVVGVGAKIAQGVVDETNAAGGVQTVDGRKKLEILIRDDQYTPSVTQQLVRELVEKDNIVATVSSIGSAPNGAVAPYLNSVCVPQLWQDSYADSMVSSTTPFTTQLTTYGLKSAVIAKDIIAKTPEATVAFLYQSGDLGNGSKAALTAGLSGSKTNLADMQSTQATDTTIQSQMTTLIATKADVFVEALTGAQCAQAYNAIIASAWRPKIYDGGGCSAPNMVAVGDGLATLDISQPAQFAPTSVATPDMMKFTDLCRTVGAPVSDITQYVYIDMTLMIETLKNAKLLTRVGIANAAQTLKLAHVPTLIDGISLEAGINKPPITTQNIAKWDDKVKGWIPTDNVVSR